MKLLGKLSLVILFLFSVAISVVALPELFVRVLDVGQGDAILIDLGELEVLIDGGTSKSVVGLLAPYVDGALEAVVLTHAHIDHYGGLDDVLDSYQVLEVITSAHHPNKVTYNSLLNDVASEGSVHTEVRRGDTIEVGSLSLAVLHPLHITAEENRNSLVLLLTYGEVDFLFTGDLEEIAETELVFANVLQDVDVLKVAHHASRHGSMESFLDEIEPEIAIYTAGEGNSYGHPHSEAIDRLREIGAKIYGTDIHGTITVVTDGSDYSVVTENEDSYIEHVLFLEVNPVDAVGQGSNATCSARTLPGAYCTITVYYKSGPSTAMGLEPVLADASGQVNWTWKVGTRTTPGTWRIVITATLGETTAEQPTQFQVLDTGNPG